MRLRIRSSRWLLLAVCLVIVSVGLSAQTPAKRPISYDAYDGWKTIQGTKISRDGTWLVYALSPQDGDGELVVRNLKTGAETRQARGREPVITADDKFVVFTIAPVKADVDKAKKEKKKPEDQPKNGLGVLNLATGQVFTADRVKSFKVPEESGAFVAYLLEAPVKKPEAKPEAEARGQARGQAGAWRREEAEGEEEGPGHGARRPRPRRGDRHEDCRGRRVRLGQGRLLARVRHGVGRRRRPRRTAPS